MTVQFFNNKLNSSEFNSYETMEDYFKGISEKYKENIVLLVNNQLQAKVPTALILKFPYYKEIKYMWIIENGVKKQKKRSEAQLLQIKDLITDQLKQLEQALL